jgi:hypothetical protein
MSKSGTIAPKKRFDMNPITWIARQLDAGWFSRLLLIAQFWFVYWILDWSMAFASTALATKSDLMGAAANIAAVAAVPQALLMMATNAYMTMRGNKNERTDNV